MYYIVEPNQVGDTFTTEKLFHKRVAIYKKIYLPGFNMRLWQLKPKIWTITFKPKSKMKQRKRKRVRIKNYFSEDRWLRDNDIGSGSV